MFSYTLNYLWSGAARSKLGHITSILSIASERRTQLKNVRSAGATCRKNATWLGVEK